MRCQTLIFKRFSIGKFFYMVKKVVKCKIANQIIDYLLHGKINFFSIYWEIFRLEFFWSLNHFLTNKALQNFFNLFVLLLYNIQKFYFTLRTRWWRNEGNSKADEILLKLHARLRWNLKWGVRFTMLGSSSTSKHSLEQIIWNRWKNFEWEMQKLKFLLKNILFSLNMQNKKSFKNKII